MANWGSQFPETRDNHSFGQESMCVEKAATETMLDALNKQWNMKDWEMVDNSVKDAFV